MCKAGFAQAGFSVGRERALHSPPMLSTGFLKPSVQTVGNAVLNSAVFTTLPDFHFRRDPFSKTCTGLIDAAWWVYVPLSTFPATTVTTTKRGCINFCFYRSSSGVGVLHPGIHRKKRGGDFHTPSQWCRVSQTDKGAITPCLARGLSRRERSHREPQPWKSR
jgi:hypothetical protein